MAPKLSSVTTLLLVALVAGVVAGCGSMRTKTDFYEPITTDLRQDQYQAVVQKMTAARPNFGEKDRLLYLLDAGLAYHYASHYDSSNILLSEAEGAAEDLYTKSVTKAAASLVLNDNALNYSGEDYEILYTNLISALNYLAMHDFDGAFVEVRRANEKLDLLDQKYAGAVEEFKKDTSEAGKIDYELPKIRFHNDVFARYLSMHMYAADGLYDDARIDLDHLVSGFETQPNIYDFPMPEVSYSSEDGAILSVVALTGMAPVKEPLSLRIRTDKDLNLVQILYDSPEMENAEYGHLALPVSEDYYFKFALPVMNAFPPLIGSIRVSDGNRELGYLSLIEDVSKVAIETFEIKKSLIYFRSVARAVVKGLAAHKAKKKADTGGLGGWLKKAAVDVVTDATENADLRCSHLLPGQIWVGDIEVDPGVYDLLVEFYSHDGSLVSSRLVPEFSVQPGAFNLVEVFTLQ